MTRNMMKEIKLVNKGRNIEYRYKSVETTEIEYLEKKSDEIYQIDLSDDKASEERDQINKNYEEKVTEDVEVLKLGKLNLQKNMDNIEK